MAFVVAFVVGVTPTRWARIWNERMPRSPLELRLLSPADAVLALERGEADVALLRNPVHNERFSAIRLYLESPVVVVAKGDPIHELSEISLVDLAGRQLLRPEANDGDEGVREWGAVVDLVATGIGVAIMPQSIARALGRKDVIATPIADAAATHIALVWPTAATAAEVGPSGIGPSGAGQSDAGQSDVEQFIGIVRGRTAASSRGVPTPPQPKASRRPPSATRKKPRSGRGR